MSKLHVFQETRGIAHGSDEAPMSALAPSPGLQTLPGVQRLADGSLLVKSFALVRRLLKRDDLRQAGFNADLVALLPQRNTSILFMWGAAHRRQRSAVAHLFAPVEVNRRYRPLMESASDLIIGRLREEPVVSLDEMSLDLTVTVAAEVVGLTNSLRPGLAKRLSRFFEMAIPSGLIAKLSYVMKCHWYMLSVYILDVRPALRAAERNPRQDLVSYLVAEKWSALDSLTECITYASAGISTTREFMVMAAWQLLEYHELRLRFLESDHDQKCALVEEILRMEPVVQRLYRRASEDFSMEEEGKKVDVQMRDLIILDIGAANRHKNSSGACPYGPAAILEATRSPHLSFGDGAHRCPGSAIAILEVVAFLDKLLNMPGVRLVNAPSISWNATTSGYVLRGGTVTIQT